MISQKQSVGARIVRKLNDWVTAYIKYTENTEPPRSYHLWTAISIIAGALQRRCYHTWGHEQIYPNMYIVLIGPSGKCRKGTAMSIGRDIIKDIGITFVAESITREALIRAMQRSMDSYITPDGKVIYHCAMTVFNEEISVFLGQSDVRFLADLTNWYDSRDEWKYETKNKGTDKISGVCFNLLGATAPDWLSSVLPEEAIGGGFTSRIIFVVEDKKGKTVAKPMITEQEIELRELLKNDLEAIATVNGPFLFTPEADDFYVNWYNINDPKAQNGQAPITDPRFSGYVERRATHLRKLSMIMSMSRNSSMKIEKRDLERSLNVMEMVETRMSQVFSGLGKSPYAATTERIILFIRSQGKAKRSEVMKYFYRDITAADLRLIEEVMTQMKFVTIQHHSSEDERTYTYRGP